MLFHRYKLITVGYPSSFLSNDDSLTCISDSFNKNIVVGFRNFEIFQEFSRFTTIENMTLKFG